MFVCGSKIFLDFQVSSLARNNIALTHFKNLKWWHSLNNMRTTLMGPITSCSFCRCWCYSHLCASPWCCQGYLRGSGGRDRAGGVHHRGHPSARHGTRQTCSSTPGQDSPHWTQLPRHHCSWEGKQWWVCCVWNFAILLIIYLFKISNMRAKYYICLSHKTDFFTSSEHLYLFMFECYGFFSKAFSPEIGGFISNTKVILYILNLRSSKSLMRLV